MIEEDEQWNILEQEKEGKSKEWIKTFYQKHRFEQISKSIKAKCPLCSYEIALYSNPTEHLSSCLELCQKVGAFSFQNQSIYKTETPLL